MRSASPDGIEERRATPLVLRDQTVGLTGNNESIEVKILS
jgi:hypothetical protein